MHIAFALNLWGDAIVNMVFLAFRKKCNCRKDRLIPESKLRLFRQIFSIVHLILSLGQSLGAKLSIKANTVV